MSAVAVLHPGRMGAAVGALLVRAGHEVRWLPEGRGEGSRRRAEAAGLVAADSLDGCDVVLSICPPAFAVQVAKDVAGFAGIYVDANAISPATATEVRGIVEAGGAEYVDGGIVGGPPAGEGDTRLYLSGERVRGRTARRRPVRRRRRRVAAGRVAGQRRDGDGRHHRGHVDAGRRRPRRRGAPAPAPRDAGRTGSGVRALIRSPNRNGPRSTSGGAASGRGSGGGPPSRAGGLRAEPGRPRVEHGAAPVTSLRKGTG